MYTKQHYEALPPPPEGTVWVAYRTPLRYGSKFQGWEAREATSGGLPKLQVGEQYSTAPLPTVYAPPNDDDEL